MISRSSLRHRARLTSGIAYGLLAVLFAAGSSPASSVRPLANGESLDSLTNAAFWNFFATMSERGGEFLSENFVSNEVSFQEPIPTLQKSLTPHGVYLGVGPEQNFTYIANLAPRFAVIFDIRRQNAMQHLMYKALFELSPTRTDFVSRLFSRPSISRLAPDIGVSALFDSASSALPSDSAFKANLSAIVERLAVTRGFSLSADDIASIEHVYRVFFSAGPDVNYGYRSGNPASVRSTYPNYSMLQSATNADTVQMAFLATEANYQAVRHMQLRNLIVPVVGDFAGPSAIRSVGEWLRQRRLTVTAFYVSNVEQYLFRPPAGTSDRFYRNVSALPIDTTSQFIRSVPRVGPMTVRSYAGTRSRGSGGGIGFVITPQDPRVAVTTQRFRDSAGVTLVQTRVDTARRDSSTLFRIVPANADSARMPARTLRPIPDSLRIDSTIAAVLRARRESIAVASAARADSSVGRMFTIRRDSLLVANSTWQIAAGPGMQVIMGGLLSSGIASMSKSLEAYFMGRLTTYTDVIDMTRVAGWR